MKSIRFGSGFAVFVLFFGVALIDALQNGSWLKAAFWFAIGLVFLIADSTRKQQST